MQFLVSTVDGFNSSLRYKERGCLRNISRILATREGRGLSCFHVVSLHAQRFPRTEADHQLEYETLRCIKQIFNSGVCLGVYRKTLFDFLSPERHTGSSYSQSFCRANRDFVEFTSPAF